MEKINLSGTVEGYKVKTKNQGKAAAIWIGTLLTNENHMSSVGIDSGLYLERVHEFNEVTLCSDKSKECASLFTEVFDVTAFKKGGGGPEHVFKGICVAAGSVKNRGKEEERKPVLVFKIEIVPDDIINTWLYHSLDSLVDFQLLPVQGKLPLGDKE